MSSDYWSRYPKRRVIQLLTKGHDSFIGRRLWTAGTIWLSIIVCLVFSLDGYWFFVIFAVLNILLAYVQRKYPKGIPL